MSIRIIAIWSCLFLFSLSVRAQTLPSLPPVSFDSFGPEVKEQVRKAYADAQAKPQDAEANGRLGMVLQTYEQYEQAAVCYERARRLSPADFRWVYYLGVVEAAAGNNDRAAQAFKESLKLKPDYLAAQLRLADALFAAGQPDESRQHYEAVIRKNPAMAQAHYGLGRVKISAGDHAAAAEHYRRALDLFPEYGAANYALGMALRNLGQAAKAQEHLALSQKHISSRPPLDDSWLTAIAELNAAGSEILKRGVLLEGAGQIAESIAEHERALTANPRLVQAHINLISLYAHAGKFDKAEEHYRAAVAASPNMADSHYNFGVLLTMQNKYEEAVKAFRRSFELNPQHAEAHFNYGAIIEREGRLDEAAEHFRLAFESKPGHRMAHFHLGRILVNQDKLAEAIGHFQKTLTPVDERTPMFTYALGATYSRAGDNAKAILYLREALKGASAAGQTQLAASIERDLRQLEKASPKPGEKP